MRVAHRRRLKVKFINQTPFQMNEVRRAEGQNTIQISSVPRKNFFFLKNDIAYSDVSDRTILRIVYSSSSYLPFQSSSSNLDIRSILKALPAIHRHIQYACLHTLQIIYFLDQKSYFLYNRNERGPKGRGSSGIRSLANLEKLCLVWLDLVRLDKFS